MKKVLFLAVSLLFLLGGFVLGQQGQKVRWYSDEKRPFMELTFYDRYCSDMGNFPCSGYEIKPDGSWGQEIPPKVTERIQFGLRDDGTVVWRKAKEHE